MQKDHMQKRICRKEGITVKNHGKKFLPYLVLMWGVCLLWGCAKQDNGDIYGDTIAGLGDEELFALVETEAKQSVLLVTDSYYEDGNGNQAAIWCEVYYEIGGEVKKVGALSSSGTAYPIAYDKMGLYAGGNHGLGRYVIDEEKGELVLEDHILVSYTENGDASFTRENEGEVQEITEEEYNLLWEAYGKAAVVDFHYGASGS